MDRSGLADARLRISGPAEDADLEALGAEQTSLFDILCNSRVFWFGFAFWVGSSIGIGVGFFLGVKAVVSW